MNENQFVSAICKQEFFFSVESTYVYVQMRNPRAQVLLRDVRWLYSTTCTYRVEVFSPLR